MRFIYIFLFVSLFLSENLFCQIRLTDSVYSDIKINPESLLEIEKIKNHLNNSPEHIKKISSELLPLIDNNFLPAATNIYDHLSALKSLKNFKLNETMPDLSAKISESKVYVYISYSEDMVNTELYDYVIEITEVSEKYKTAVAWIYVKNLTSIAKLSYIRSIKMVIPPITRTGSFTSEGDNIHRTSNVRSIYGKNGSGIKVGIISDGVNSRASAQLTGDLPPDGSGLTVLSNNFGGDEGTAMLEIVHDLAPEAELYFHDLGGNTLAFNSAIDDLVSAGCNIICDDIGWLLEPFFEDGTVAEHVRDVLATNNIIYVSSAGNSGNSHYQGTFYSWNENPDFHDFNGASADLPFLYLYMPNNSNVRIALQWDDAFLNSSNDYDLYLYSIDGNRDLDRLIAYSLNVQNGNDDPVEFINYNRLGSASNFAAVVHKNSGIDKNLEIFVYTDGNSGNYSNNIVPQDAIYGHPAVDEVVSVGAVDVADPDTIEFYSSQGPSTIAFPLSELRSTPKIAGADGNVITGAGGFGYFDGTNYRFYGTSASAPHIAAILAQAWSYDLLQTADDVKQLLYTHAQDMGGTGYDNIYGYGLGDALNIFDSALPVEFASFSASVIGNSVKLDWRTETEVNNYGFEVEKQIVSNQSAPGKYEKIGFVEGNGNSNSPKTYTFRDDLSLSPDRKGILSYRLKQIDNDGKYAYSEEVHINIKIPLEFSLEQNYPNPFNPVTKISWQSPVSSHQTLKVYDVLGNEVATLVDEYREAGRYEVEFQSTVHSQQSTMGSRQLTSRPGSALTSGIYLYRLEAGSYAETRKMILLK